MSNYSDLEQRENIFFGLRLFVFCFSGSKAQLWQLQHGRRQHLSKEIQHTTFFVCYLGSYRYPLLLCVQQKIAMKMIRIQLLVWILECEYVKAKFTCKNNIWNMNLKNIKINMNSHIFLLLWIIIRVTAGGGFLNITHSPNLHQGFFNHTKKILNIRICEWNRMNHAKNAKTMCHVPQES